MSGNQSIEGSSCSRELKNFASQRNTTDILENVYVWLAYQI